MPKGAFRLPTGVWLPRDTFALREETWSAQGTFLVPEKASPGEITTRGWKTEMRWKGVQSRWQTVSVDLNFDPFRSPQGTTLPC